MSVLPTPLRLALLALVILGAGLWIGGMAAVTILTVSSRRTLPPALGGQMFREFGRRYFAVAGTALVVTVICGAVLLLARGWDGLATSIAVLVAAIGVTLAFGVRQARAMGRLRAAAARAPATGDALLTDTQRAVAVGARRAVALRTLLGLLSAAVFVLSICTAA